MKVKRLVLALVVVAGLGSTVAFGAVNYLLNITGPNCHAATSTTGTQYCYWNWADADGYHSITYTYTGVTLTTGAGSCDIKSCTSGGPLVYCGNPITQAYCDYSVDSWSCDMGPAVGYVATATGHHGYTCTLPYGY